MLLKCGGGCRWMMWWKTIFAHLSLAQRRRRLVSATAPRRSAVSRTSSSRSAHRHTTTTSTTSSGHSGKEAAVISPRQPRRSLTRTPLGATPVTGGWSLFRRPTAAATNDQAAARFACSSRPTTTTLRAPRRLQCRHRPPPSPCLTAVQVHRGTSARSDAKPSLMNGYQSQPVMLMLTRTGPSTTGTRS